MKITFRKKQGAVQKTFSLPGDKSIAHRALIICSLAEGSYTIQNFPQSLDCMSTLECIKKLGVAIKINKDEVLVSSPGYRAFIKQPGSLMANNSGTTARLLSGMVAGSGIQASIDGDSSLRKRPMDRVVFPLKEMGAELEASENYLPLNFIGTNELKGIEYNMSVASAQVKSCILIAGFLAEGQTTVIENKSTRNHTEIMFQALGADIKVMESSITIRNSEIKAKDMYIPGDISSAAFLIASTLLSEASEVKLERVLLNERRKKYLDILIRMGANLKYEITESINGEPSGTIIAATSSLKGIHIVPEEVPNIIDEIPVLAVLSAFSEGTTVIEGIKELKYKESNRIKAIVDNLSSCGVVVKYSEEFIEITGGNNFIDKDVLINPYQDHRIALAFTVFAARNLGNTVIENWECTSISFPDALEYFKEIFDIHIH